jgi:hypothetical protein
MIQQFLDVLKIKKSLKNKLIFVILSKFDKIIK